MGKETKLVRTYRMVLSGATNGDFCSNNLSSVYRSRLADIRKMMREMYGDKVKDWVPGRMVEKKEDLTIWRWRLLVPGDAIDEHDPLEILPERKEIQERIKKLLTQPQPPANNGRPQEQLPRII